MYANHHISKLLADERVADRRREAASPKDPRSRSRRLGASRSQPGVRSAPRPPQASSNAGRPAPDRAGQGVGEKHGTEPVCTPAGGSPSHHELVRTLESAAAGDSDGWGLLVHQFAGMMWAIARAHRLTAADAADVSQTTWLKLLEKLDQIQDPARVGGWLATTARRECLRVLRGSGREASSGDDIPEQESSETPPDEAVELTERDQMLWRCFARLRPGDQALLRLLLADPRPAYEEISAALDMPIGSIGPTRARALERLRQEIESENELSLITD
jgi:RNA polymerase sigma factor (sigma-70 family)